MSLPLEEALRQCDRHAQRMSRAMARIPFPLDGHELAEDNENLITLIDQFVFRYTKLQDTLGEHVLRPHDESSIDRLAGAAKAGI